MNNLFIRCTSDRVILVSQGDRATLAPSGYTCELDRILEKCGYIKSQPSKQL